MVVIYIELLKKYETENKNKDLIEICKTQVARDKLKYSLCKEHGLKVIYFCDKENASYYDGTDYIFFTAKDEMMKYIKDNEGKVGE